VKFLKSLFSGQTLSQAHILTTLAAIATGVATLVPAWGPEAKIIVASLGGIVTAAYPLVAAVERALGVVKAGQSVSLAAVVSQAEAAVRAEVSKVDFNQLVKDAENLHGVSLASVEAVAEQKVRQILAQLSAPAPAPVPAPAPAPAPAPVAVVPPPAA
jgi:hypothetical protein